DDDLRSDSWVWADLTFPDGTKQKCVLHPPTEDSWGNNSMHRANQCILGAPKKWSDLKATRIVLNLTSHTNMFLTFDNWNVNEVRVTAIDAADKHYPCLLDARANPFL